MNQLFYTPLNKLTDPVRNGLEWSSSGREWKEGDLLFLKAPFVKHYEGTIFQLSAPVSKNQVEPGGYAFEKTKQELAFQLPDGGNGRPYLLDMGDTLYCPDELLSNSDRHNGPCRITSITPYFHVDSNQYAIPDGFPPFLLSHDEDGIKNIFHVHQTTAFHPNKIEIYDKLTASNVNVEPVAALPFVMSLKFLLPGFYQIIVKEESTILAEIALIKLFPIYLAWDDQKKLIVQTSIW